MTLIKMNELHRAWDRIREVGGSIHSYSGHNFTASADGWTGFANHANLLCGPEPDNVQSLIDQIVQIAADAEDIRRLNEPMLSVTVCSKPRVTIKAGCRVLVKWSAYDKSETGCKKH
jgi:hypothetical protein